MKTLTAAIQFGSSRICAAAAKIHENGTYEVTAIESVFTAGCIQHGCVANVEETAQRIKSLMQKLSNRVKSNGFGNLQAAYVGLCGISMHSVEFQPTMSCHIDKKVPDEVIAKLEEKSRSFNIPDHDVLGLKSNGVVVEGDQVTGLHQIIIGEQRLKQGYVQAMERANIRIAGFLATPLMLGDILTADERKKGCLLLDLGSHLTSVSIYKDGALRFLTVLPLGGNSVTRDIDSLGKRMDEAEELKINWSDASLPIEDKPSTFSLNCPVDPLTLNLIVTSRYEEIIANVVHQITLAGFTADQFEAGCVVTGGASMQKGLTTLLSRRLGIAPVCTRSCNGIKFGSSEKKPHLAALMSMLPYCRQSCEEKKADAVISATAAPEPVSVGAPAAAVRGRSIKKGFGAFIGDLFSGLSDE